MLIKKLLEIAQSNPEGFTVWIPDLEPVTSGIAVAYAATQNSHGENGLRKCLRHAIRNGKVVGGWKNPENDRYYFDSVRIFKTTERAIAFGRMQHQIAIYDLDTKRVIKL